MRISSSLGWRYMAKPTMLNLKRFASSSQLQVDFGPTTPAQRPRPSLKNLLYVVEPALKPGSFARYIRLAKLEVPYIAGAVVGVLLYSGATLAIPAGFGMLIDYASKGEMPLGTSMQLLGCFGLAAVGNLIRVWCIGYAGERMISNLRRKFFGSVLWQPAAFFDLPENRTGSLVQRLSMDCNAVGSSLTQAAAVGSKSLIQSVGSVGVMLYFSPLLTTVIGCLIPPIAIFAGTYGRHVRKLQRSIHDAIAGMGSAAEDRLSSIRTVKAFAAEPQEEGWLAKHIEQVFSRNLKLLRWRAAYETLLQAVGYGAAYCILWAGSMMVASGSLTPGVLFSFMLYTLYCGSGLIGLANVVTDLNRGYGASLRLFDIIEMAERLETVRSTTQQLTPQLSDWSVHFKDVCFAYPTRPEAMVYRHLNLTIQQARCTCIVGSSGSGKSSLALLLLKLYEPSSGVILLAEHDLANLDDHWLRGKIGYVGQEVALFGGTIAQNIAYGFPSRNWDDPIDRWLHAVIVDAAKKANAHDFISALPEGYDTFVGEGGRSLSGGEKQRVAIARALLCSPRIVILDEATSALDSESEVVVHDAIFKLIEESRRRDGKSQLTVLMFAHKLSAVRKADHIVVLHDGAVAIEGSFEEVCKNDLFRSLMGLEQSNRLEMQVRIHFSRSEAKSYFLLRALMHTIASVTSTPPAYSLQPVLGDVSYSNTDPEALCNLIVNYLPPLMDEAQLFQLFSQFGPIESIKVIYDRDTHESRGYGFVRFRFFFSATYAISCLNRFQIAGKRLKVAYANATAAKESYTTLKDTLTQFTAEQQVALQTMYYNQTLMAKRQQQQQQQISAPARGGLTSSVATSVTGGD